MLRDMMKDREIWIFLILIVIANTIFISGIAQDVLPDRLYAKGRFLLLGAVLVAVVWSFRRTEGVLGLIRPMGQWRINPLWFVLCALWAPFWSVVTVKVMQAIPGVEAPELHANFDVLLQPSVLLTVLLAAFIGEIVWVSYAIGRLSKYSTTLLASLIVGTFWTLWWVPIVVIGVGVIPGLPLSAMFVNMLGVAAMCGFIYAQTKSGLAVLTLQLALNSSILVFPVVPTTGGVTTYWVFGILYTLAALAMHVAFGPKPLLPALAGPDRVAAGGRL